MKTAMKHLLRSTVLLLAFAGATRAQDSTLKEAGEIRYRFLDIPWASQASKTRAELTSHGFTVSATDRDGDIPFSGRILDHEVIGWAMMSPTDGLAKIQIVFQTRNGVGYRDIYREVVSTMTQKYGAGEDHAWFESPYTSGDGYEDTAIRVDKGHVYTTWAGLGGTATGLIVDISKELSIDVQYESSLWHKEVERRRSKAF
jgi:hypothetical protein